MENNDEKQNDIELADFTKFVAQVESPSLGLPGAQDDKGEKNSEIVNESEERLFNRLLLECIVCLQIYNKSKDAILQDSSVMGRLKDAMKHAGRFFQLDKHLNWKCDREGLLREILGALMNVEKSNASSPFPSTLFNLKSAVSD